MNNIDINIDIEIKKIYNKVLCDYKRIGSEIVVFVTDYPYIDIQKYNDTNEHACNMCYYVINKRSVNKTMNYEFSSGCVYKLIDNNENIMSYNYKEHKRIKTRTLGDVLPFFFEESSLNSFCNNKYEEHACFINPKFKKTIVDKLLIIDYDKYIEIFNEKEHIKSDRCQICDSTEICGEKNINNEIILYCNECNPYI